MNNGQSVFSFLFSLLFSFINNHQLKLGYEAQGREEFNVLLMNLYFKSLTIIYPVVKMK